MAILRIPLSLRPQLTADWIESLLASLASQQLMTGHVCHVDRQHLRNSNEKRIRGHTSAYVALEFSPQDQINPAWSGGWLLAERVDSQQYRELKHNLIALVTR